MRHEVWGREGKDRVENIFRDLTEAQRLQLVLGLLEQCATLAADYAKIRAEVEGVRTALREALSQTQRERLKESKAREEKDGRISLLEGQLAQREEDLEVLIRKYRQSESGRGVSDLHIIGLRKQIKALTEANKKLAAVNEHLLFELQKLERRLRELEEWFGSPKLVTELEKLEEAAARATDLQRQLDEMTVDRSKWVKRVKALEAGTPAPKKKSGGRRMIKPAMALLGLACTASAVPVGNRLMNETSLARYCADDTVEGTFYGINNLPFTPKDDTPRTTKGLYHMRYSEDGGSTYIATILLTPPSHSGIIGLPRDCRFRTGELPRVLATHQIGRSSPFFVRIAEGSAHRWLHFEHSGKPKELKWQGKTEYVGTTVPKGERIVLAVDGEKIVTEMILTDTPSTSVNIGFMFAARWFSSRFTERLGLSHTVITSEKTFDASDRVTATGEEWVESRSQ